MNQSTQIPATNSSYIFKPGFGNDFLASKLLDKEGKAVAFFPPLDYPDISGGHFTYILVFVGCDNYKIHALDDETAVEFVRLLKEEFDFEIEELLREEIDYVNIPIESN